MKQLIPFFVLALTLIVVGCGNPPPVKEETPVYSQHQIDHKIDSLWVQFSDTISTLHYRIGFLKEQLEESQERLSLCRLSITELPVPDSFSFCGIELPLQNFTERERFQQEVFWLYARQDYLLLYLLRANQWFPDLKHLIAQGGMPDDLKYVCVGESGLSSRARSAARAQGWWQFIKETGERYDLVVNGHIDTRNSLIESTNGAIKYFNDLLTMFNGDWALALAGYNMGENGLRRRIRDQKTSNYFELELSYETSQYVFRMAAIKYALENPELFGIDPDRINYWEPLAYDTVTVNVRYQLPVNDVAQWCGVRRADIRHLNPEVKTAWPQGNYLIKLPFGKRDQFIEGLSGVQRKFKK